MSYTEPTQPRLQGYKAFYRGKTADIYAATSRQAIAQARQHFKATGKNRYFVFTELCEIDGKQYYKEFASL